MTSRRDTTLYPEKAIRLRWPTATAIRQEDRCPDCKARGLFFSYVLPERTRRHVSAYDGALMEDCGWGNAGSRPVGEEAP